MPGLDNALLELVDHSQAIGRILTDIKTDFILAPHYSAVYAHIGEELWDGVKSALRAGTYEPELPITIDVIKKSGLSRPGAILSPRDRLVYQALVDLVAVQAEKQLDRTRAFSNVLLDPDPEHQMFQESSKCWNRFQVTLQTLCGDDRLTHVIKADVASFFEGLYQHNLINLLHASECPAGAVNLLEGVLLTWMEKASHGILQGIFPSDFLGNFYLLGLDSELSTQDIPSARYVDDLYIFYPSIEDAQKGLVDLCGVLRHEGLHLNESKSSILDTTRLLHEETALDRQFAEARVEIENESLSSDWYGFQTIWLTEEELTEEEIEIMATESLFNQIDEVEIPAHKEKIEKFCLPIFSAAGSEIAVDRSLIGVVERPHLAQLYCSYLGTIAHRNQSVADELISLVRTDQLHYDWQLMWLVATLLRIDKVPVKAVNALLLIMRDTTRSVALRALCAQVVGKHGHAGLRRNLRHFYSDEPSGYVRAAILFATKYFPTPERRSCMAAWSGHSVTNSLVARAVQAMISKA